MISRSTLGNRLWITGSLSLTLAPPSTATNGRWGSPSTLSKAWISAANSSPAADGRNSATIAVEAWARWAVPNASLT